MSEKKQNAGRKISSKKISQVDGDVYIPGFQNCALKKKKRKCEKNCCFVRYDRHDIYDDEVVVVLFILFYCRLLLLSCLLVRSCLLFGDDVVVCLVLFICYFLLSVCLLSFPSSFSFSFSPHFEILLSVL